MDHAHSSTQPKSSGRVGVEIELGGLDETVIAGTIMYLFGGQIEPDGALRVRVRNTRLGDMIVELDTAFAETLEQGPSNLVRLARHVVPYEIITDPLDIGDLPKLDTLVKELRIAGATGNDASVLHGFGVHFNPEVTRTDPAEILRTLQAFALLEPWLRAQEPMGLARRALPFTDPWPVALRDALTALEPATIDLETLIDTYLTHAPSRNYGLDMLPLFGHLDRQRVARTMGEDMPSTRPTYHFRLPTSRIDVPGWTISAEWQKWQTIQSIAKNQISLVALCRTVNGGS